MVVRTIVGVLVVTVFFIWTMLWFIRSSLSENPRVRRRLQFADGLISVGIATGYALSPTSGKDRHLAVAISGLVIVLWLFRGAKALLRRAETK
jgi:hypothetical protein